jgi:hypothetical protein
VAAPPAVSDFAFACFFSAVRMGTRETSGVVGPTDGAYTLQVFGTGVGKYTLDSTTYDVLGGKIQGPSINGNIIPGVVERFTLSYSSTLGSPIVVTHNITVLDIANSIQAALQQGLIDNRGIANSLLSKLRAAQADLARGNRQSFVGVVNAFINEVRAQTGQHIQRDAANLFITDAQDLLQ